MPSATLPGSALWALSILQPGMYMADLEVVQQRIALTLGTLPGTCPLNPLFGCNVPEHADEPIPTAVARIKRDILEALSFWVPEIKVRSITHGFTPGVIDYTISYTLTDGRADQLTARVTDGVLQFPHFETRTILPATILKNAASLIPQLTVDGQPPASSPPSGFASVAEMHDWVSENWSQYGAWGRLGNGIVLYLGSGYASAELQIVSAP